MVALNQNFAIVAGDSVDIEVALTNADGDPVDLTDLVLRWGLGPMDARPATLVKSSFGEGEIEITDAAAGIVIIHLQPADTTDLIWLARHELEIVDGTGATETVAIGTVTIHASSLPPPQPGLLPAAA